MADSFGAKASLEVSGREYEIHRLDALQSQFDVARLPYSLKVLLENVLRLEDGESVTRDDVETIATWDAAAEPSKEIPFQPARVLMQDFTGVPAVVDLAAMRDAMEELGSDAAKINPLVPVDLVIDHSVQVDAFGNARAFEVNAEREFERNGERYEFLRWGQKAFDNFRVVPPATGICHQVNLEYLGKVVWSDRAGGRPSRLPRHARRHRLPHHDDQRPQRARLGRRRDRGRGRDARPADLDAAAAGDRLPARRGAPRGRDRHRPRPARHRDASRARGRQQVRRVLRARPAEPRPRRPGDARQHVARVRIDLRDLPAGRRDAALPGVHGAPDRDDRARRRLHARAGHVPHGGLRGADLLRHARARPRRRRALHRRAEATAGPDLPVGKQELVPGDAEEPERGGCGGSQRARRDRQGDVPRLGPARRRSQRYRGGARQARCPGGTRRLPSPSPRPATASR